MEFNLNRRWLKYQVFFVLFVLNCSHSPKNQVTLPFEWSQQKLLSTQNWQIKLEGPLADLVSSSDGTKILVSTLPDPEIKTPHLLSLFDQKGKRLSRITLTSPAKNIEWVSTHDKILVNNYEGKLIAFELNGEKKWEIDAYCKPIYLTQTDKIFCYHDDDAIAKVAFDVFDLEGRKIHSQNTKKDVLFYKFNTQRNALVLGFVGGEISVYDSNLVEIAHWKLSEKSGTELVDLAIYKEGVQTRIAALTFNREKGQEIHIADFKAEGAFPLTLKTDSTLARSSFVNQIEWGTGGSSILIYGNNLQGQTLARYQLDKGVWNLLWEKKDPYYADYSHSIKVVDPLVLAGFEKINSENKRVSKMLLIDSIGQLKSDLDFETKEGAYLVQFNGSVLGNSIIIGTDDKTLTQFGFKLKE